MRSQYFCVISKMTFDFLNHEIYKNFKHDNFIAQLCLYVILWKKGSGRSRISERGGVDYKVYSQAHRGVQRWTPWCSEWENP